MRFIRQGMGRDQAGTKGGYRAGQSQCPARGEGGPGGSRCRGLFLKGQMERNKRDYRETRDKPKVGSPSRADLIIPRDLSTR